MDIKVPHSWLKEFLHTKATPEKISECLALCGPSVERIHKIGSDYVYDIEVTTNRVDSASITGIAREASAILPQFGIKAQYKAYDLKAPRFSGQSLPLEINIDKNLNKRVMAVVLNIPKLAKTPEWMKTRLEQSGMRSLNLLVDITNYVMLETGHPTHVFDYDKIKDHTLSFRLSKKGEKATSFDGKTYTLPGNDIVIVDNKGEIIDLPGIIGTKNSVVSAESKRVIFFIDNNDSVLMRKTSLSIGIRTIAVQINEKNVDPQLGETALLRGLQLYETLTKAKQVSKILDFYPQKPLRKKIDISLDFIVQRLGADISASKVKAILDSLGFLTAYNAKAKLFKVEIPSFRSSDVEIPEDIVEEVARIYGYHNVQPVLMSGALPDDHNTPVYDFENKVKHLLKGWGGIEIYTISLVSKSEAGENAIALANPLGTDTAYLRTTLYHTTMRSIAQNSGVTDPLHLFEVANVYLKQTKGLPTEHMMLAGSIANTEYRYAKGILEALLETLHINASFSQKEKTLEIKTNGEMIARLIKVKKDQIYYEFDMAKLFEYHQEYVSYKPIPKYPAQVEDITFVVPSQTHVIEIINSIKQTDKLVHDAQLVDTFKDAYTFRIWYRSGNKTLTDKEVEKLREKVVKELEKRFGVSVKN